jgi:hypothetical protein
MNGIGRSPSSPGERLISVPLANLRPHPANANVMAEELLTKLTENIRRQDDYPPLVVRPHPAEPGTYQVVDGHQRWQSLVRLGKSEARCYLWPCDDRTALVLLSTLNRLEGQDDQRLRAELIRELNELVSLEELALLLPEDQRALEASLSLLDMDIDGLLADLQSAGGRGQSLRSISFAVTADDEQVIEAALSHASANLDGANSRGRALADIARMYLGEAQA